MTMTPSDLLPFSELLKVFRMRRHLTQQQLAVALGMHRHTIGRWEQGDFLPATKAIVLELAQLLRLHDQEARQLLEASLTSVVPYWQVPLPRNPFFTGREEILNTLHRLLRVDRGVTLDQTFALQGLGGVGKTQIALEYAYRHTLEYSAVFWIGAETDEQVVSSLLRIAEVLQLPERDDKDQQRVVTAVQRWLSTNGQWLLIWDNVEDLAVLDRFLPPTLSRTILITTRCHTLGTRAQAVELFPMEHKEGMLFLLRRAKVLDLAVTEEHMRQLAEQAPAQYAAATELVTNMGGLPLALDQAGAYLETTGCSLPAYLDLFRIRRAALLQQRGEGASDHPASVSTTFTLALTATAQRHPAVWALLQVCALLQPDAIPEELFRQGGTHLGATLETASCDEMEWDRVVAIACSYSLLLRQPEEQMFSLHRLVQAVLLDTLPETERKQWIRQLIGALDAVFPEMLAETVSDLRKQCARLLPHVLLCLHRVETSEESLIFASLVYKTARYLRECGRYTEAEPLYRRALRIREQILGPDHPDVAITLNYLGVLYWQQGKHAEAEALYRRALQIYEQQLASDQHLEAIPLNNLAILYFQQGKYEEAKALYRRALQIYEQILGADHPRVSALLYNLAELHFQQGKYGEAEPLYWRALSIYEQQLGSNHLLMASPLTGLAELYREQGKYEESEPFYQRALQIREQVLGPDHPDMAYSLNNLANLYREQGKYTEAELLYIRALHIREQQFEPDHPLLATPLNHLAELYREQGRYKQAEPLFQRALRIWVQALGPDSAQVAKPLNGLANLYREQGKDAEAESLYLRALSIREQQLGQHHPETAQTLHDLAVLWQKQGKLSEAISLVERALAMRFLSLGDNHPQTVTTRALMAQLLQEQARAQQEATPAAVSGGMREPLREDDQAERASLLLHEVVHSSVSENDHLKEFFATRCEFHPRAWSSTSDLWQAYVLWTETHQERFPLSRRAFGSQLKAHGCHTDRTSTARIWRGIALMKNDR